MNLKVYCPKCESSKSLDYETRAPDVWCRKCKIVLKDKHTQKVFNLGRMSGMGELKELLRNAIGARKA